MAHIMGSIITIIETCNGLAQINVYVYISPGFVHFKASLQMLLIYSGDVVETAMHTQSVCLIRVVL